MSSFIFDSYINDSMSGDSDLDSDNIRCALMTEDYSPGTTDTVFDNAYETSGTGYTAGGKSLSGKVTVDGYFRASTLIWENCTISVRWAVLYNASRSNRLIAVLDFGETKRCRSGTFTVSWDVSGILRHRRA